MNADQNRPDRGFAGHGMKSDRPTIAELEAILNSEDKRPVNINPDGSVTVGVTYDELAAGLTEDMPSELPTPSVSNKDRGIFERSIAARRAEKLKQQAIAAAAMAKVKALTLSIRSMEDALDGLLVSEVA